MTKKRTPCYECGASGRAPHASSCGRGARLSAAARKGRQNRRTHTATPRPRTRRITQSVSASEPKLVNRVALIVDRSGSMAHIHNNAIEALNSRINELKAQAHDSGQETYVSIYDFGSHVNCVIRDAYVHSLRNYTVRDIRISGMTALMDAVSDATRDLESLPYDATADTSFLIEMFTDGMENQSRITRYQFTQLIARLLGTDRYTFAFSGPIGSRSSLENLGIPTGCIQEWEQTEAGVQEMTQNVNVGIQNFYATRSAGGTSTKSFFTPDLGSLSDTAVQRLTNLSSRFHSWNVDNYAPDGKPWEIRNFVIDRLGRSASARRRVGSQYQISRAYYELTKPTDVQPEKSLLMIGS